MKYNVWYVKTFQKPGKIITIRSRLFRIDRIAYDKH